MKKIVLMFLIPFFLVGCAATPERIAQTAKQDCLKFEQPSMKLSSFSSAKLEKLQMIDQIAGDQDKAVLAKELEKKLQAQLNPMVTAWPSGSGENETLIIQPKLVHLRMISKGTRLLVGLMAGQSSASLQLNLIDSKTGEIIASPEITKIALGRGGQDVTDDNLLDYLAGIAHQYVLLNM
jgi:PBP1b-binding outer membrane lipoprotein LpoB